MKKTTVACFFGGKSAEYNVSLVSATAIIKNINREKFNVLMIGIAEDGNFYHFEGNVEDIENNMWMNSAAPLTINASSHHKAIFISGNKELSFDIAFPILHGTNGEDGRIQGLFELLGIKYVGCDMSSSSICMDKYASKLLVESHGVKIPKSLLIDSNHILDDTLKTIKTMSLPLFIKPLKAGSSFGITKIHAYDEFEKALEEAFYFDNKVIIEENIDGFEVGCAIIGNDELLIGAVDEIEIADGFFNFEEKYSLKTSKIHLPARISVDEMQAIQDVALKIYKILGCKGCARVDLFYTKDKQIVFNEVNTMPGFTSNSRFPNMLKAIGYTFEHVIEDLIRLGLEHE